jgi:tRNA G37 N-methylase Trm5
MNMMRHLKVPNVDVELVFNLLKQNCWHANDMLIHASDNGNNRLIPLNDNFPTELSREFLEYEIINCEGKSDTRVDPNWLNHLSKLIKKQIYNKYIQLWPSSHEFIGDMMIVRIDEEILKFSSQIAQAKLEAHPKLRLVMSDGGVLGELRIRELKIIGVREENKLILQNIPTNLRNTKVVVKESGREILCDPSKAYFSTKLQTERQETLFFAKKLHDLLGRKINVCDPVCGVGPALASLLSENNLVDNLLASDLNPDAIEILFENLTKWDKKSYNSLSKNLQWLYPDRLVGVADAIDVSSNENYIGKWDLLIINLPHRTLELLPKLLTLLDTNSPSLIRGRVVVEESNIDSINKKLNLILPNILQGSKKPELQIKRDYSSKLRLCSFEAWLE